MPYASKRQAAFIHAEAKRGSDWAKKFVEHSHGTKVGEHKPVKHRKRSKLAEQVEKQ